MIRLTIDTGLVMDEQQWCPYSKKLLTDAESVVHIGAIQMKGFGDREPRGKPWQVPTLTMTVIDEWSEPMEHENGIIKMGNGRLWFSVVTDEFFAEYRDQFCEWYGDYYQSVPFCEHPTHIIIHRADSGSTPKMEITTRYSDCSIRTVTGGEEFKDLESLIKLYKRFGK